jgi:hypothetical protein
MKPSGFVPWTNRLVGLPATLLSFLTKIVRGAQVLTPRVLRGPPFRPMNGICHTLRSPSVTSIVQPLHPVSLFFLRSRMTCRASSRAASSLGSSVPSWSSCQWLLWSAKRYRGMAAQNRDTVLFCQPDTQHCGRRFASQKPVKIGAGLQIGILLLPLRLERVGNAEENSDPA